MLKDNFNILGSNSSVMQFMNKLNQATFLIFVNGSANYKRVKGNSN